MARKRSSTEKAAWISGSAIVVAAIISVIIGPMYEERPILAVSFGNGDDLPLDKLQYDGTNYYVDVVWKNTGKSNGKTMLEISGTGALVSFNENGPWDYIQLFYYTIYPGDEIKTSKVFVKPEMSSDTITIQLNTQISQEQTTPLFQELNRFFPSKLIYEKSDNDYQLVDKR